MPLDTAIHNVGEYYSAHYLDSTFARDIKDLKAKWNERGSAAPPRRLQALSDAYFRAKGQALEEDDPRRRRQDGQSAEDLATWHGRLLYALGYEGLSRLGLPVEGGDSHVPTLARVQRYNRPWLVICETVFCWPEASLKDGMASEDPLEMDLLEDAKQPRTDANKRESGKKERKLCDGDWGRGIGRIFTEEDAPRWVMLLAGSAIVLLDRTTYAQGRYLAFELDESLQAELWDTVRRVREILTEKFAPDGFNVGVNDGRAAGQTITHAHIHIIPRYEGDVACCPSPCYLPTLNH